MTKRPIAPLSLPGVIPEPPLGGRPELTWMPPTDILVQERYQRSLSEGSRRLITSIVRGWDWRRYRPAICAYTDDGIEAIDGQHSLIAAATLGIPEVPVIVVEAAAIESRAELFVAVNADRLALTEAQLHAAKVLSGDPEAVRISTMCKIFGIRLLRVPPPRGAYKPRDSMAFRTIASLLRRYEQADVERILAAIAETDAAPISAVLLKAAEHLLTNPEFASEVDPGLITAAAASLPEFGDAEAKLFAATHCVPMWRAFASVWFKASKKLSKRPAPKLASLPADPAYVAPAAPSTTKPPEPAARRSSAPPVSTGPIIEGISRTSTGGHMIDRRPISHICELGELPGPGRSALDQRRASH